jgi:aryl-alcohol dehydrogenase-like predicted oxidoreductase
MEEIDKMQKRIIGKTLEVSAIGLGCMGLSHGFGPATDKTEAIKLLREAFEIGYTFYDTAEIYGPFVNEEIVGEAFEGLREKVIIATKFGITDMNDKTGEMKLDGSPVAIKRAVDSSLKRLKTDWIDLYYQHRQDPNTPVEIVAETMNELITLGKIRHWGLSATDADTIRRAHTICPVSAVESEYSMMYRKIESDVLPVCEELGIAIVPYSPLAKGFLSGTIDKNTTYPKGDLRNIMARFKPEVIDANQELLLFIKKIARERQVTPAQISLTWVMARNPHIVPIPGTRNIDRLKENAGAADVELTKEEYERINALLYKIEFMEVSYV